MPVEDTELAVGDARYPARVNEPEGDTDHGVVVLPGMGHGPFGDVFDRLARALAADGRRVFRYESWEDPDKVREKRFDELHRELDAAVDRLQSDGCQRVDVVAKSFGGAIAITHVPDAAERLVLWAPAVRYGDPGNAEEVLDVPIEDIDGMEVGPTTLEAIDVPTLFLHGDEDEIPLDGSRKLAGDIPDARVSPIEGEDHSFLSVEDGRVAVERTVEFLR